MYNYMQKNLSSLTCSIVITFGLVTSAMGVSTIANAEELTINQALPDDAILSRGPNGEEAVSAKTLSLSESELKQIRDGGYTAAIAMHYAGNDWSQAQITGLEKTFNKMGIEIVAVTDAQFKSEKQVADIETLLARTPDVMVSIPVDPVSTAHAYKRAAESGVEMVFMDNKPNNMNPKEDYTSVVSADNYGNGVEAAHIMADALDGKGNIGVIYHDADFFVTQQRTEGFEATITNEYPNIEITVREGISGPNDGERVASAMLTRNPTLDGLFVVWDVPAEGALSAARTAGRRDLVITTIDLGANVALDIARGGMIKGLGAQLPYEQGVAEAILAGYALIGKEAPSYVAVPALRVTQDNVLDAWQLVYNEPAPSMIQDVVNNR